VALVIKSTLIRPVRRQVADSMDLCTADSFKERRRLCCLCVIHEILEIEDGIGQILLDKVFGKRTYRTSYTYLGPGLVEEGMGPRR
jgi:hypothetical protein